MAKAVAAIAEVRDRAEDLRENMGRLGQQAEGIGRIMGVISDIADETNRNMGEASLAVQELADLASQLQDLARGQDRVFRTPQRPGPCAAPAFAYCSSGNSTLAASGRGSWVR